MVPAVGEEIVPPWGSRILTLRLAVKACPAPVPGVRAFGYPDILERDIEDVLLMGPSTEMLRVRG